MTYVSITVTSFADDNLKYVFTSDEVELYKDRGYGDYRVTVTVDTEPLISAKILSLGEDRFVSTDLDGEFYSVGLSITGRLEFTFVLDLDKAPRSNV